MNVSGMTLRDYLAAKAMQGVLASPQPTENPEWFDEREIDDDADFCYRIADALIRARERTP